MSSFVVHHNAVDGPGTHALLIGVGYYPHLLGGEQGQRYPNHGGMRQLSSPPLSALALGRWLVEQFDNPARPLASVAMLASGESPVDFEHPRTGAVQRVQEPTMAAVETAVDEWVTRADSNPDNLALFYFCGHGIAHEPNLALLLQDFGARPLNAMAGAIDFPGFHLGMEQCRARRQCFFIDACRVRDVHVSQPGQRGGRSILGVGVNQHRELPRRYKPVFYSTFEGERAQARTGEVSLFTEALLRAFEGGGADDTHGDWWVDTSQMQKTVQFMMERAHACGYPAAQINPVDDMSNFRLHRLQHEPRVPVSIGCRPSELNSRATLSWSDDGGGADSRPPESTVVDWDTDLPVGRYEFRASLATGSIGPVARGVRPPFRVVELGDGA